MIFLYIFSIFELVHVTHELQHEKTVTYTGDLGQELFKLAEKKKTTYYWMTK